MMMTAQRFSKRGCVRPEKNPRRGRGVLSGCLIDKNDSEGQRQGTFPVKSHPGRAYDKASIRHPAAIPGDAGTALDTRLLGNLTTHRPHQRQQQTGVCSSISFGPMSC